MTSFMQFVPNLPLTKNLASIIALAAVVASVALACGGSSDSSSSAGSVSSSTSGVLGLVPDSVGTVRVMDVGEILQGNAPEMADGMVRDFEDELDGAGISIYDVSVLAFVEEDGDGYAMLLGGEFDFDDIRDALDDAGYDDDDYREYELWEGRGVGGGYDVALLEDDGYVIMGMASGAVQDVLKSLGRDSLLLKADDNPLKRVLDRAGRGWLIEARSPCRWNVRGCDAMAIASDTSEDYSVELTIALLFQSDRSAKSAERRIGDILEAAEDGISSLDYEEVIADGEFIVVKSSVDEDDIGSLLAQLQLESGLNLAMAKAETAPRFTPGVPAEPMIIEKEIVKEVPVEVIVEKEVVKEVPREVIVIKEVVKEVPVEVIKEVVKEVPVEVIVIKEVVKEVPVEVIVEKEVVKEVQVEVIKEVPCTKLP